MTQSFVKSPLITNETTTVSTPYFTTSDIISENVTTIMLSNFSNDGIKNLKISSNGNNDENLSRFSLIITFFCCLFICVLVISYFAWSCAKRQNELTFEYFSDRSSATTTLRPNIAIVRDSGTTQTIVNNAIVNNGSRVPISRNIVKNMEPVRDHIARVKTVIVVSGTS